MGDLWGVVRDSRNSHLVGQTEHARGPTNVAMNYILYISISIISFALYQHSKHNTGNEKRTKEKSIVACEEWSTRQK